MTLISILVGTLVAGMGSVWLAALLAATLQHQALVPQAGDVGPDDVARAVSLLRTHDPRQARPGQVSTALLSQRDLDVLLSHGLHRWLGARLAQQHHTPIQLSVLARGESLQAIRAHGVQLSIAGQTLQAPAQASDQAADLGAQDLVLVALKAPALGEVAGQLSPLIGPHTVVLTVSSRGMPVSASMPSATSHWSNFPCRRSTASSSTATRTGSTSTRRSSSGSSTPG